MNKILSDYYRVPEDVLGQICAAQPSGEAGYFQFGSEAVCYGQCTSGVSAKIGNSEKYDAIKDARVSDSEVHLPFDPAQIVGNLRTERYVDSLHTKEDRIFDSPLIRRVYYLVRELLPVAIRKHFQKMYLSDWKSCDFRTGRWILRWTPSTKNFLPFRWKPPACSASHSSGFGPKVPRMP